MSLGHLTCGIAVQSFGRGVTALQEGIDDDGEHGAASHILRILQDLDARDTHAIV